MAAYRFGGGCRKGEESFVIYGLVAVTPLHAPPRPRTRPRPHAPPPYLTPYECNQHPPHTPFLT